MVSENISNDGQLQLTRRTTTLRHLRRIMVVAQWFLVRFGKRSLSNGFF